MRKKEEKEDVQKLVAELKDLMDGPGPDVEAEVLNMPSTIAVCGHCKEPVTKAPGSVEQHKLLTISEPKKSE